MTGSFVTENPPTNAVQALRETAAEWDVSLSCRCVFPWKRSCNLAVGGLTQEQLVSRLILCNRECRLSSVEVRLPLEERKLSLLL